MHGYKLREPHESRKFRNHLVLQNLPDLPSPHARRLRRGPARWLRRIALAFLLISSGLMLRSAWAAMNAVGS